MLTYILFVIGFILLIKGADLLVDGAASFAGKFKIPTLVIGLTIVALGTSAPELVVNIFASISGSADIAIGNILGSNIANILLILGVSALIFPLKAKKSTIKKEIPFSLLAILVLGLLANDLLIDKVELLAGSSGLLSRIDGLILLAFFIIFLVYTFGIAKNKPEEASEGEEIKDLSLARSMAYIGIGIAGLIFGGKWIVDGAVKIAELFNASEALIGLTIVAIGTSLPELATSAVAAYKKQTDIAIGNVVGSNIFNLFFVLGISATIKPLPFSASNNIDIGMIILSTLLLLLALFIGKKRVIKRWQGAVMVLLYLAYLTFLIIAR